MKVKGDFIGVHINEEVLPSQVGKSLSRLRAYSKLEHHDKMKGTKCREQNHREDRKATPHRAVTQTQYHPGFTISEIASLTDGRDTECHHEAVSDDSK